MSTFDWASLAKHVDLDSKNTYVKEWLDACDPADPIYLSDVLVRASSEGLPVMEELARREKEARDMGADPQKWKILSVRDEWGNTLGNGDKVVKVNKVQGKATAMQMNIAIMDGSYADKYERRVYYTLDNKGCFEASFTDAAYFLLQYGIHGKSGLTMTRKQEKSGEPLDTPAGGMLHKWYWRYKEVDAQMYAALPRRPKRTEYLRGIERKPEGKANDPAAVSELSADARTDAG